MACPALRRPSGSLLEATLDAFGTPVVMDDGILVISDEVVSDTQTQGAVGMHNGGPQMVKVGDMEDKDAGCYCIMTREPMQQAVR